MALLRILWLDDAFDRPTYPGRCSYLVKAAREVGHYVICCQRVPHAVGRLATEDPPFDLMIVDFHLDPEDGPDASSRFIKEHVLPRGLRFARVSGDLDLIPYDEHGSFTFWKGEDENEFLKLLR